MRATGIVRRIDDLGRVVIPKEIRRTMRIREGDPLEIYTDRDGEVIFKKYSPVGELGEFVSGYAEVLAKILGFPVFISDRDAVVSVSGASKREYSEHRVTDGIEKIMDSRMIYTGGDEAMEIIDGGSCIVGCAMPIISEGDIIGCVMSGRSRDDGPVISPGEAEIKLIQTAALFLAKYSGN